ncbi:MAG: hypothetical protein QG608_1730 [Actinomycetota bacterium]|nr:hypothetical protein [Actinomycetota bacterium]
MRTILNIIWLVFSGFWMALGYALVGVVLCLLVVTIPFGIACLRMASYALWPFGRVLVDRPGAGAPSVIGNVLWFLLAGVWIAIGHVVTGVLMCLTIIGIPLGLASFKMVPVALWPLGKEIVPVSALRKDGIPAHAVRGW